MEEGYSSWINLMPLLLLMGVGVLYWLEKRIRIKRAGKHVREAPAKTRRLDINSDTGPFHGWWQGAKRGKFRASSDRISCSDIGVASSDIEEATLYSPTDHLFGSDSLNVLRVKTRQAIYDFSVQGYMLTKMKLPFEFKRATAKILSKKHRRITLVVFIVLVVALVVINSIFSNS